MWKDTLLVIFQIAVDQITGGAAMEVVYPRCCGLDVHKRFVVACLSLIRNGERPKEIRQFSTGGKRLSGRIRQGNRWAKTVLIQAAHAAAQTQTYLGNNTVGSGHDGKLSAQPWPLVTVFS
jgi:hypothetical protein